MDKTKKQWIVYIANGHAHTRLYLSIYKYILLCTYSYLISREIRKQFKKNFPPWATIKNKQFKKGSCLEGNPLIFSKLFYVYKKILQNEFELLYPFSFLIFWIENKGTSTIPIFNSHSQKSWGNEGLSQLQHKITILKFYIF